MNRHNRMVLGVALAIGMAFVDGVGAQELTQAAIEQKLDLSRNEAQEWTYFKDANAWVLSIVPAVALPEIPNQQGVSVCVPGDYVTGIDTNGDGKVEVMAAAAKAAVKGALVIDNKKKVTSPNGQVYTAATAPVILNTGAAGYGSSTNQLASTIYASAGYINVSCGNRGKQDKVKDAEGNQVYTGDAPSCLVDQKAAARFVKYNILLGNLPGNVDYFVSTGGSGGGAHAVMFAATSNHPDFYDYQIAAGAVGVSKKADGTYSTTVRIKGKNYEISDGAWGSIAYSAITSLYEADMAMAFEYSLNPKHTFNTPFQAQVARFLAQEFVTYINSQGLSVKESAVGFDLNADGDRKDSVGLTIGYDLKKYPDTNGYFGTYLDLYLAEFTQNLQSYADNLAYTSDWTWFDKVGKALSDQATAALTPADRTLAFVAGRYTKGATAQGGPGGMMGPPPGGTPPAGAPGPGGDSMMVGTPDAGTTQSATSKTDSSTYKTYADMVASYQADLASLARGDTFGRNLVSLYDPLKYIGSDKVRSPRWTRVVMGASEGDMSMLASLNLQVKWLNAGVDADLEWQWDGGHVPSEVLGNSFTLSVDQMYGKHVAGAIKVTKPTAVVAKKNGTATEAKGKDLSSWVNTANPKKLSFTVAAAAAYRSAGASKATPGFDVIDYGQEDYVFGNQKVDARHWSTFVLKVFQDHGEVLSPLFNAK